MHLYSHISDLIQGAERSWQYSKDNSVLYGALGVTLIPTAFIVEESLTKPSFETTTFRFFIALFAVPLLLYNKLPQWIGVLFPYYWILTLLMVFPFSYSVSLIQNAALSEGQIHPIWLWEYLFSMFVLVQFTSHTKLCAVIFVVGNLLGSLTLSFVDIPNWKSIYQNVVLVVPVLLTTLVILLVSNRHIFKAQEQKLIALRYLGNNIAHELRTPLATIRNISTGTGRLLPDLVEAYDRQRPIYPELSKLRPSQIDSLRSSLVSITDQLDHSSAIIDLLLLNTLERPIISLEIDEVPAEEIVRNCVKDFPFGNEFERSLVTIDVRWNFTAFGPRILLRHIIFNLLKNAVRHVQKVEHPRIAFTIDGADKSITISNNGPLITSRHQKAVFQRFFTTVRIGEGNGIGLSFCKIAMESIAGKISLTSNRKSGTSFKLTFAPRKPKLMPRIAETPDVNW